MKRKTITTIIALFVVASMVLTACGGATAAPAQPTSPPAAEPANPPPTSPPSHRPPSPPPAEKVALTIWHNWGPDDAKGAPLQIDF